MEMVSKPCKDWLLHPNPGLFIEKEKKGSQMGQPKKKRLCLNFNFIFTGEELSLPMKHANKLLYHYFWLWRPQSMTHAVDGKKRKQKDNVIDLATQ